MRPRAHCSEVHIIPYTHARSVIAVRRFVQHDICYALNAIVIRRLVQHKVISTELHILKLYDLRM